MNSTALAASGPGAALGTDYSVLQQQWRERVGRVEGFLRGDHAVAQLIRFAVVGGLSNVSYALLFMVMDGAGPLVANVAGSIVSTVIANELHRRLTFRAAGRVGWFKAQWEGGGLALVGLVISTAALAGLQFWAPGLGELEQASAVIVIMAAVGGLRFVALRGFVFSARNSNGRAESPCAS